MRTITRILAVMVAATLTGPVAAAAPIAPAKDVHIKITDNIREAVGTLDVQFAIVVDKHNHIHVFTVSALKHPAEAEAENPAADDESPGNHPPDMGAAGGKFSTQIRQEVDGCWWLTRRERNQDGALIEAHEICIGGRGCPVGERRPVAKAESRPGIVLSSPP
jgi:hypothetical protein